VLLLLMSFVSWPVVMSNPMVAQEERGIHRICSGEVLRADRVWGGTNVFFRPDRTLWVQEIRTGETPLSARRYSAPVADGRLKELNRLVNESGFADLSDATRGAVPDEAAATIALTMCNGQKRRVRQFLRDAAPAFKAVLEWFDQGAAVAKQSKPCYEGAPPEFAWRPE